MKFCDQCGAHLNDNAKFCSVCGTPVIPASEIPKIPLCKNCGEIMEEGASYCANCGSCNDNYRINPVSMDNQAGHTLVSAGSAGTDTIEYLKRVVMLEKSVYTQASTINAFENRIRSLGHPEEYSKPKHRGDYFDDHLLNGTGQGLGFGASLGPVIWILSGAEISFWTSILLGALGIFGIVLAFNIFDCTSENKRRDEEYEDALAYYTAAKKADKVRVEAELAEMSTLVQIVEEMEERLKETVYVLEEYYTKDIIFPKYRNLVAVCSFYEYFMSGRCNALTGHEGAYNIFENEVRLERICTKLDEVVQKLEEIKANQYVLYDAIQEGNRIMQRVLEETIRQSQIAERTEENTALAAHYSEIAANNAEACVWIGIANYYEIRKN